MNSRHAAVFVLALALAPLAGYAAQQESPTSPKAGSKAPSAKQAAQRERMKSCNAEAGERKGDERKKFMSSCLSGETGAKPTAQQQKMKDCNREASAKQLKGDERKKFMSTCLKG
jgi:hypothetical protein